MYKAFIVVGGESTGTRLVTQLLINVGCVGDSGKAQRLDKFSKEDSLRDLMSEGKFPRVVWRRSVPHASRMPNLEEELMYPLLGMYKRGEIFVVVTTRNWLCAARSAVNAGHCRDLASALVRLERAYTHIFEFLKKHSKMRYHMVSYDALISSGNFYLPYLFGQLQLNVPFDEAVKMARTFYNGNTKHYWEELGEQTRQKRTTKGKATDNTSNR